MILAYCRAHPWTPSSGIAMFVLLLPTNPPPTPTIDTESHAHTHTNARLCVCGCVCVSGCVCYLRFSFFIIHCKESSSSILEGFSFLLFLSSSLFCILSISLFIRLPVLGRSFPRGPLYVCVYCVCSYLIFVAFLVK